MQVNDVLTERKFRNEKNKNMRFIKKNVPVALLALSLVVPFAGCGEDKNKQVKSNGLPRAEAAAEKGTPRIAYVDLDSLQNHYQFFMDGKAKFEAKQKKLENALKQKGEALQKNVAEFQRKLQQGEYTSEQQARNAQSALAKQESAAEQYRQASLKELDEEQTKFNEALHDSLNNYLSEYNKTHKYSMILSKSGDNILYADKSMDITDEVIAGLNKRYNKK